MHLRKDIRNIAIIAHVDHGKTTLVDGMLRQSGIFRANEAVTERVMDSNELEKERGITILAKNTSIRYKGTKINIVDTPGHADFGGEVERILKMVDGVLLLVDAFEGPMPQTKFVLRKSLNLGLKPIVVINKIDRPDSRPEDVVDMVFDLFVELNASDDQLDFPIVYASAKQGIAKRELDEESENLEPLFDAIVKSIPLPPGDADAPLQMLATTLDYNDFLGRLAIGRVFKGRIKAGSPVSVVRKDGSITKAKITKLFAFEGLTRAEISEAAAGEIVALAGLDDVTIGETIADFENPTALPPIHVDEPTLSMNFIVNNSPFAGREGKFVTTRNIADRLQKELRTNVSLRVEETGSTDSYKVSGRGELHLSILIETMRREGFELQVSKPEVILKNINGQVHEPIEHLVIDVDEVFMGSVIEKIGLRKGEMADMVNDGKGHVRIEFLVPARGLIGFRGEFMTDTKGSGVMNHTFHDYQPYKGEIGGRRNGVLIAHEDGEATAYALWNLEDRGIMFVEPGAKLYPGMIIGQHSRDSDLVVNPCKKKQLSNMRASGADEAIRLTPPIRLSLEQALEYIEDDELVEVTPKTIRLRKKYLNPEERKRNEKKAVAA
ncbi:MAG: translational GTPase TypA [Deltaproteobacteria bacterium]|nr:translational GTPase TypA [Deltaproteobacteria bacterium]